MTEPVADPSRPWYLTFHDLMPVRVRDILLVSSPYDAFTLEEDGRLTERITGQLSDSAPRITHVSTGARAMELLAERNFDLVVTMVRLADTDVSAFARAVRRQYPKLPVLLLVLTEADLAHFPGGVDPKAIDRTFVWTGDSRLLPSIVKLVEDRLNVDHDTRAAGVRVIIVVEDSVRRYSSFVSLLYEELAEQSESLASEGVNELHRLMRSRTRPKVLLATTFEEAMARYRKYREYVGAVITDVGFPRNGEEDPGAGFELVKAIRAQDPELPVLLQSADPANATRAVALGLPYADKNSPSLLQEIRSFVTLNLGFGDFVFRLPDRTEVARARDVYELEELLRTVPAASVEYHATRNHFSLWLMARSRFRLAKLLRPQGIATFGGVEGVRAHLLRVLREARLQELEGTITDYARGRRLDESVFVRVGTGSIGGKARGVAFIASLIARSGLGNRFPGLRIRVPRSVVIGTAEFDRFLEDNRILDGGLKNLAPGEILARFLAGRLPASLGRDLKATVALGRRPLAVRSSSLLEDSQLQPFAGIYATYMLPNNHPDPEVRLAELGKAIRAVYASTYSEDAQAYIGGTPYSIEEEKMAVLIQEIVGRAHGSRFYPPISGVALSYNYYPVGPQRAEDGLALVALGLGQTIVQGGAALQFSPANPEVLPQFGSTAEMLRYSQARFYALDLSRQTLDFASGEAGGLKQFDLDAAEEDGTLQLVGSVYSREDDLVRENFTTPGPRLVTFAQVLRYGSIPLAPALREVLALFRDGLGAPVELEFALDAPPIGRGRDEVPTLHVLQVRPQATQILNGRVDTESFPRDEILCHTDRSLGHGIGEEIRDIVYVKRSNLGSHETPAVAAEVGRMNARLAGERAPYLLVGPGRWGSSDPRLGIPVKWAQIAGAKVIVETSFEDRSVEPSQGAHFFHNVTSFRIGYLTLFGGGKGAGTRFLDERWLREQPTFAETAEVRHVRLDRPLRVYLDGRHGTGTVLKPAPR
jgi:CheY-like chemotaxis protein